MLGISPRSNLEQVNMERYAEKMLDEGLTWKLLISIASDARSMPLLDNLLRDGGVQQAGARATLILRILSMTG